MHTLRAAAFDAGLHCPTCAAVALGMPLGELPADARDREGNPVTVLYSWEIASADHCDDCHDLLD